MRKGIKWFFVLIISLLLVFLAGYLIFNVLMPATEHLWMEDLGDGRTRVDGRILVPMVVGVFLVLAAVLAGVTKFVDWMLFPEKYPSKKNQ